MKSVVELPIDVEQSRLAQLFAEPRNNPLWMDDLQRIEPVEGELGQIGSRYRLVSKRGPFSFVATVLERSLPHRLRLRLDDPKVSVLINAELRKLTETRTLLVSEERFLFPGLLGKALGLLALPSIRRAHRRHMEGFRRFAERS